MSSSPLRRLGRALLALSVLALGVLVALTCLTASPANADPVDQPETPASSQAPGTTDPAPQTSEPAPATSEPPASSSDPAPPTSSEPTTSTSEPEQQLATLEVVATVDGSESVPGVTFRAQSPDQEVNGITPDRLQVKPGPVQVFVNEVPDGYFLSGALELSTTTQAGKTTALTIQLQRSPEELGKVVITARDRMTGEPLAGGRYLVVTCSGNYITAAELEPTGDNEVYLHPGCYTVLQNKAAPGYVTDLTPRTVQITNEGTAYAPFYNLRENYVAGRNPAGRHPISSIPSGRVS